MKFKKLSYLLAILTTGAVVALSVLLPATLLTQDRTLNQPSLVNTGSYSSQPNRPGSGSATPTPVSLPQLSAHVSIFRKSASTSILSRDPVSGNMGMEDAVKACIKHITPLLDQGTIPELAGFPNLPYTVSAEPRTIMDSSSNPVLQYWNVSFAVKTLEVSTVQTITISLDAQTGIMLSLNIVASGSNTANLEQPATIIAQDMHMPGTIFSLKQEQKAQVLLWKFTDSALMMQCEWSPHNPGFDGRKTLAYHNLPI